MAGARVALALMCVLLLVDAAARRAEAASYNVGNSAGWDLSADLPSWANGKTFYVGDVLGTIENLASIPPVSFVQAHAAVQSQFPPQPFDQRPKRNRRP